MRNKYYTLAAQNQRHRAGQIGLGQRGTAQVCAVDKDIMLFDRADGLRQIGHPGDGQPRGSPGAGLHDRVQL